MFNCSTDPKNDKSTTLNNQKTIFIIKIYSYLLYCVISLHNKNEKYCEKHLHNGYNKESVIEGDLID